MCTVVPTYVGTPTQVLRDQLILRYAPLVRYAVGSMAMARSTLLDIEDLYSYGTLGLIDAIDRFDPTRGVKFETYAVLRIRGYLIDQIRALDWLPRTARSHVRVVQRAGAQMEMQLGRTPSRDELAVETGLPSAVCERALMDSACQTVSLESLSSVDEEGGALTLSQRLEDENSPNPALTAEQGELRLGVSAALRALPERERQVLELRYEHNWTLRQIALYLCISDSRASQLHSQALARMRRLLIGNFGDLGRERLTA